VPKLSNCDEILSHGHGNGKDQNEALESSTTTTTIIIIINSCIININAYYKYIINA
jgi:hypothetical protein